MEATQAHLSWDRRARLQRVGSRPRAWMAWYSLKTHALMASCLGYPVRSIELLWLGEPIRSAGLCCLGEPVRSTFLLCLGEPERSTRLCCLGEPVLSTRLPGRGFPGSGIISATESVPFPSASFVFRDKRRRVIGTHWVSLGYGGKLLQDLHQH